MLFLGVVQNVVAFDIPLYDVRIQLSKTTNATMLVIDFISLTLCPSVLICFNYTFAANHDETFRKSVDKNNQRGRLLLCPD